MGIFDYMPAAFWSLWLLFLRISEMAPRELNGVSTFQVIL